MTAQREWFEKDYYAVLGVAKDASAKDITRAYRRLARQFHPDANPGDTAAEERFKQISAAYDVIGDEAKRTEYDEVRAAGPMGGFGPGGFAAGDGLGDLLGQMFGRGRRGTVGPRRGDDLESVLTLDFVEAARGLTTTLHLTADSVCSSCSGGGARPGTTPKQCGSCGGRGSVAENQGPFSFSSPCRQCGGAGRIVEYPCATCRGSGLERRPREVNVRIPAGVDDGQRIRLKGRGSPGRNGGPAGDLLVECRVAQHPVFARDGLNLLVRVAVPWTEAVLGGSVEVPVLEGDPVRLRLKPGTQAGSRHRVKNRGISTQRDTGDLIVTVEIDVPARLTDEQRAAVEALHTLLVPATGAGS